MNKIQFYREGKTYYYVFQDKKHEVSEISINKLKEKLVLPYMVTFTNLSFAQSQKLLGRLIDKNTDYEFTLIEESQNTHFEAKIFHKKNIIDAYYIPSKMCLYGRNPNCKPYILHTLENKKILMEVTKDFINEHDIPFYFIHSELTDIERDFFSSVHRKIECDYVYQLTKEKGISLERRKR